MTIPLQTGIVYGPVNSRRLGRSLGVNIVSTKIKTCTFNCVYCQYGLKRIKDEFIQDARWYPSSQQIQKALENVLPILSPAPDYITFSGNGESTLHPDFTVVTDQVIQLRDKYAEEARVAILSNSSTVMNAEIRQTLNQFDDIIMKLDCGNVETFQLFNQPIEGIAFEDIISGLQKIDRLTIQALFAGGSGGNYTDNNIDDWIKLIRTLNPVKVQIYTLDRPYPSEFIKPLNRADLLSIKSRLDSPDIDSTVY